MELQKRNNALYYNDFTAHGRTADIHITRRGSDWYFAVCAIMATAAFIFMGLGLRRHRRNRIFHYITSGACFVAAIAYFSMGSNLGFTPIQVEFARRDPKVRGVYREIFYVRYIDWFVTTPLIILDLMLTAGMPWPTILFVILADWIMIVCGLVGALVRSIYKWGYFAFGCFALLYILYHLVWESRRNALRYGTDVHRTFVICGALTALVWICYPVAWGVSEGGNVIAPDSEAVFYGILDLVAKVVFGALLIWRHRDIDPARLGLQIRDYDGDDYYTEKMHRNGVDGGGVQVPNNGHHNGHHNGAANGHHNSAGVPTGGAPSHVPNV